VKKQQETSLRKKEKLTLAEDDVTAVQPGRDDRGDEELGAVGVRAGIGHGQRARRRVRERKVLVGEARAVDGLAAHARAVGEVAALQHEVGDDAVEGGALVGQGLALGADALLA
jgi:hypothetical protein